MIRQRRTSEEGGNKPHQSAEDPENTENRDSKWSFCHKGSINLPTVKGCEPVVGPD